jgi:hypothetical protein
VAGWGWRACSPSAMSSRRGSSKQEKARAALARGFELNFVSLSCCCWCFGSLCAQKTEVATFRITLRAPRLKCLPTGAKRTFVFLARVWGPCASCASHVLVACWCCSLLRTGGSRSLSS